MPRHRKPNRGMLTKRRFIATITALAGGNNATSFPDLFHERNTPHRRDHQHPIAAIVSAVIATDTRFINLSVSTFQPHLPFLASFPPPLALSSLSSLWSLK
jgi:hypothetical protein